jgi:hypothetical protein
MNIQKGMMVSPGDFWYVVVNTTVANGVLGFDCICDHANNIYYFNHSEIIHYISLSDIADGIAENPSIPDDLAKRGIPYQVIVEVLSGKHDSRFYENK